MAEVKIPEVGESITEGILVEWLANHGAMVKGIPAPHRRPRGQDQIRCNYLPFIGL